MFILNEIAYVEFYVSNAIQSMHFFRNIFGFHISAYAGPETGLNDRVSYLLEQGTIRLILSSGIGDNNKIKQHIYQYGEGVKDIAFKVNNAYESYDLALARGAKSAYKPYKVEWQDQYIVKSAIKTFGNTIHSFISSTSNSFLLPFFIPLSKNLPSGINLNNSMQNIDHIAICIEQMELMKWADFYQHVLNFKPSHYEDVETEYSGMNSIVMSSSNGLINFPLVSAMLDKPSSKIQQFIELHKGAGVQHIAFAITDILKAVKQLNHKGLEFIDVEDAYYEQFNSSHEIIKNNLSNFKELKIMIDVEMDGILYQIFSKPIQPGTSFFIELIQRDRVRGFGTNNIKALFEASERVV